jgi:hypothetical protein
MRVFNTSASDFWRSKIGEQLRWLKLTNPQYHRAKYGVVALVEKVARAIWTRCKRAGLWPTLVVRKNAVVFDWRARGTIEVVLDGTRLSYSPDPIRRSSTLGMILDLVSCSPESIDKFLKGCLWHLLEVRP